MVFRRTIGLLLAALILTAACGREDDRLSSAEFREHANAVCAEAVVTIKDLGFVHSDRMKSVAEEDTYETMADYFDAIVAAESEARDSIASLQAPSEDEAILGEFLSAADTMIDLGESFATALRAEDVSNLDLDAVVSEGKASEAEVARAARAAGLPECVGLQIP